MREMHDESAKRRLFERRRISKHNHNQCGGQAASNSTHTVSIGLICSCWDPSLPWRLIDSVQVATLAKLNGGMHRPEVPTAASLQPAPFVSQYASTAFTISFSNGGFTVSPSNSAAHAQYFVRFGLVQPHPLVQAQASCFVDLGFLFSNVHFLRVVIFV